MRVLFFGVHGEYVKFWNYVVSPKISKYDFELNLYDPILLVDEDKTQVLSAFCAEDLRYQLKTKRTKCLLINRRSVWLLQKQVSNYIITKPYYGWNLSNRNVVCNSVINEFSK